MKTIRSSRSTDTLLLLFRVKPFFKLLVAAKSTVCCATCEAKH